MKLLLFVSALLLCACSRNPDSLDADCWLECVDSISIPINDNLVDDNPIMGPGDYMFTTDMFSECAQLNGKTFFQKLVGSIEDPDAVSFVHNGNRYLILFEGKNLPEMPGYKAKELKDRIYIVYRAEY
ncbi:hypothetical protein SAMN02745181_1968 [Rubritalea squalenifaciens DSM 18772]|uniref:Lipoprotein n=1 Tax=Rubritalea squalenifaciens DSM 18772 TaxID=1123071 RepID=A0A1M6J0A1_9BACT|nr:hypothetical protein [Rubritalea squalenifaciens]SHJ40107.1 hypothetical protein SAMN02745181_1968 [Rubritalea squalenifaciens DSM 18772]